MWLLSDDGFTKDRIIYKVITDRFSYNILLYTYLYININSVIPFRKLYRHPIACTRLQIIRLGNSI